LLSGGGCLQCRETFDEYDHGNNAGSMNARPNPLFMLRALLGHQGVARAEIEAFQNARLRRLVRHAWEKVPYYRRLFERHGLKPQDIRTLADLAAIPISSKKDLQPLPTEDVVARGVDANQLIVHQTSGSTGQPTKIRRTWFEERVLNAFRWRAARYFGLRATDRYVSIRLNRPLDPRNDRLHQRLLHAIGLYHGTVLDCRQPVQDIVRQLRDLRPVVVDGLSGALWRVSLELGDADRQVIRPRFVHCGGEVLTPTMRRKVSEAFGAPVYETYGSYEFNHIAWQCKETGDYHTCDDSLIVEILEDGKPVTPGERGELVATNLHSFAMPFIRFRLGDIVTKGAALCACGAPFSTIRAIQGRMADCFPLPDGRLLHPYQLGSIILNNAPWVGKYQFLQERLDRIILRAVPLAAPSTEAIARVRELATQQLGPKIEFEIALESDIPLEPSGKFRISRSLVNSNYDDLNWTGYSNAIS